MSFATSLPESFLYGLAAGSVGFYSMLGLTQLLVTRWFPKLKKRVFALKDKERYYFWALGPSTVHSVVQVLGTAAFLPRMAPESITAGWDTRLFVNYGWTGLGPCFYSGIFVGYLLADFVFLGPQKLGFAYVFHHLSASAAWTTAQLTGSFQFIAQLLQFNEFSTIFMNLRQLYLTAGYDSSSPQVLWSSLLFFASFAVVRVAPLFPLAHVWITRDFALVYETLGLPAALLFSSFLSIHACLQGMWFHIMVQRLVSKFGGGGGGGGGKKDTTTTTTSSTTPKGPTTASTKTNKE